MFLLPEKCNNPLQANAIVRGSAALTMTRLRSLRQERLFCVKDRSGKPPAQSCGINFPRLCERSFVTDSLTRGL